MPLMLSVNVILALSAIPFPRRRFARYLHQIPSSQGGFFLVFGFFCSQTLRGADSSGRRHVPFDPYENLSFPPPLGRFLRPPSRIDSPSPDALEGTAFFVLPLCPGFSRSHNLPSVFF